MEFYKQVFGIKHLYHLYKLIVSNRYTIGIAEYDDRVIEEGFVPRIHWIQDNYKKGWFADPFILRVTDEDFILLVEEFVYKLGRGIISQVTIDRGDYSIKNVKPIIDTGFHLSFPNYYRKDSKVFIFPEQSERGGTWLYEYDEVTCRTKELWPINPNATVDSSLLEMPDGRQMLTCTTSPYYNGSVLDLYPFYEQHCPSLLKPALQVDTSCKTARNAGAFFKIGNRVFRPAQYCKNHYGEATEIQEIKFGDDELVLTPVNLIHSPNREYPDAFHTFNVFDNRWIAVDGRRKRFPLLAKMIRK